FFQAEDGIRDFHVTGVQTCALSDLSDSGPCVTHIGPGGSGHYVKMVHNGIEYGDMQLIAETYDIMRNALGMSALEIGDVFERWRSEERRVGKEWRTGRAALSSYCRV